MLNWQKVSRKIDNPWLTEPYVLSAHLKAVAKDYQFELLNQGQMPIADDDAKAVGGEKIAWVRTIAHRDGQHNRVFGRVVVPSNTYQAYEVEFGSLKTNPIGETLLFYNREVRRGPFEVVKIERGHPQYGFCFEGNAHSHLWARRSIFYWRNLPLIVIEIFMPDLPEFEPQKAKTTGAYRLREKLLDYIYLVRLHRPLPILLMFWPTFWALWLASGGVPELKFIIIFALGVLFMRSLGDVLNDLADRKFDGFVERTRMRPLATGRVSVKEALLLCFVLAVASFILVLFLNPLTIGLAFIGLGLAALYPFMKRLTYYPQVVLGFAYNWGIIMAFAAIQNTVPWVAWGLWVTTICWTVAYDTWYAVADLKHDEKIGIKSTAIAFGSHLHLTVGALQTLTVIGLAVCGYYYHFNLFYYIMVVCSAMLMAYEHKMMQTPSIKTAIQAFNHNHWVGLLIFIGIGAQFL